MHHDAYQTHAVLLGVSDQRAARDIRISRRSSGTILIPVLERLERVEHLIVILQIRRLIMLVRRRNGVACRPGNNPEGLVLVCRFGNQRHIVRRRVMVLVKQTVRIGKMRVGTSQLRRFFVHHVHKMLHRTANMLRHCVGTFICRIQHNRVQALLHRHLLPVIAVDSGTLSIVDRIIRKCDDLIQIGILQREKRRHDFRDTCRIIPLIAVFFVQNRPRRHLHQYHGR